MDIKSFTVNLFSESLLSKTTNISSTTGARQGMKRNYCSSVEVFYTEECNFIYIISNNRMTVRRGYSPYPIFIMALQFLRLIIIKTI